MTDKHTVDQHVADRIDTILRIAHRKCRSFANGMTYHYDGYSEPGYTTPVCGIIALGNWNDITKWNPETKKRDKADNTPSRVCDLLERLGVAIEWSDEWTSCGQCGGLVRTSPDSYGWEPSYGYNEGEITCRNCLKDDPASYLESIEQGHARFADERRCLSGSLGINPADYGYVKVNDESFETGWHPGQNDNPDKVGKELEERGIGRYLFSIDDVGQFDSKWSVWVHKSEAHLLTGEKPADEDDDTDDCDDEFAEPEEGDYTTTDHVHFRQYGKVVVTIQDDEPDWRPAVRAHMEASQFWPNVWFISDHGNAHLLSLDE